MQPEPQLTLIDMHGEHISVVPLSHAQEMHRDRQATLLGNKRRVYAVKLLKPAVEVLYQPSDPRLSSYVGQSYSTKREGIDAASVPSPENLWRLRRISRKDRHIFRLSITDCLVTN